MKYQRKVQKLWVVSSENMQPFFLKSLLYFIQKF